MVLGDMIARLDDEAHAMQVLMGLGDPGLVLQIGKAADDEGLTPGAFTVQAVQQFSAQASDEDWVSLIGAMGRSVDPGQVCLKKMVEFALRPATEAVHACGHHR